MKIFSMIMMKIFVSHALHRMMVVTMALSALMFTACSSSDEEEKAKTSTTEVTVTINVEDAVGFGKSRALADETENKISNIHILAFNYNTGAMLSNGYTTVDDKSSMTCKLAISGTQDMYVVLYAIANIGNKTVFDDHALTRSEFENLYVKAADADKISAGTYKLCKADGSVLASVEGETHALLVSPKVNSYHERLNYSGIDVTLSLVRQSPKIILNLYGNDINLLSYQFFNIPTSDNIMGNENNMDGVEYGNTTEKPFADNTISAENLAFYALKSYKAPNTSITKQRDRTDSKAPENAAYLDIKGSPVSDPSMVYRYRVYLGGVNSSGVATPYEFSILRNHDYYLNIVVSDYLYEDYRTGHYNNMNATLTLTPWSAEQRKIDSDSHEILP
ncbi:MAG: DUF4906 domain-containing protein [Prevotella sp.]|nr:DUF4906 domain-containing protein [Prevotella sp.]